MTKTKRSKYKPEPTVEIPLRWLKPVLALLERATHKSVEEFCCACEYDQAVIERLLLETRNATLDEAVDEVKAVLEKLKK